MLLHFHTPSIEVGEETNHRIAASAVKVLPDQWIEVIIWAVEVWETKQATAEA